MRRPAREEACSPFFTAPEQLLDSRQTEATMASKATVLFNTHLAYGRIGDHVDEVGLPPLINGAVYQTRSHAALAPTAINVSSHQTYVYEDMAENLCPTAVHGPLPLLLTACNCARYLFRSGFPADAACPARRSNFRSQSGSRRSWSATWKRAHPPCCACLQETFWRRAQRALRRCAPEPSQPKPADTPSLSPRYRTTVHVACWPPSSG